MNCLIDLPHNSLRPLCGRTLARLAIIACLFSNISFLNSARAIDTVRTVALSGMHAPGTDPGVVFGVGDAIFSSPRLTQDGKAIIPAVLAGAGVNSTNNQGIWTEVGGSLSLVVRMGGPVPGQPGVIFSALPSPGASGNGRVGLLGVLSGAGINNTNYTGIWITDPQNNLVPIVQAGNPAPGTQAGDVIGYMSDQPNVNNNGQTAFRSGLAGPGVTNPTSEAIWSYTPGSGLTLVARQGFQALGAPSGQVYNFPGIPSINSQGKMVFSSFFGAPGDVGPGEGLWSDRSGQLAAISLSGDPMPGVPGATNIGLSQARINSGGQIVYLAGFSGPGVNSTNDRGVLLDSPGTGAALVARTGDQAPSVPSGVVYANLPGNDYFIGPTLNSSGQVAFGSGLAGSGVNSTNGFGIWAGNAGALKLVFRTGDQAPGAPVGANFSGFPSPALNSNGQVAFTTSMTNGTSGIWATDLTGVLRLIVRTGQLLDVSDDPSTPDMRTVSQLGFLTGFSSDEGAGVAGGFNNLGQVAFYAKFADGTQGFFVSNLVAVPEPGVSLLLIMMVLCLYPKRSRGHRR